MSWYSTGSIAVTNGSTTVTGTGTNFLVGAQIGEAFLAPDGNLYEIASITSATVLVLADPYLGGTQSGQSYKIVPTQSLVADLASDVTNLISTYQSVVDGAGSGKFQDGTVGAPAITFEQDQDNGLYRIGVNNWGMVAAGAQVANVDSTSINFPDNKKATFGTGDDLQIYHDGSNSFIDDAGTGALYLRTNDLRLQKYTGETFLYAIADGKTELYFDNAAKLATTSTGIDVTGTVVADGLTVESEGANITVKSSKNGTWSNGEVIAELEFHSADTSGAGAGVKGAIRSTVSGTLGNAADLKFYRADGATNDQLGMTLASNGDISFYEDTGTTAKFFWDASAESLGIGTSSPLVTLHAENTSSGALTEPFMIKNSGTAASTAVGMVFRTSTGSTNTDFKIQAIGTGANAADLKFLSDGDVERMRIDSSGNVGIGEGAKAHFGGTTYSGSHYIKYNSGNNGLEINSYGSTVFTNTSSSTERMRIDSSGNLLVGTTDKDVAVNNGTGFACYGTGFLSVSGSGYEPLVLNRKTNDGAIATFRKDGTTVGSIGSYGGTDLTIGSGDTGLRFYSADDKIWPYNTSTGLNRDAAVTLGDTNKRFKDLYLSGGVYLGGTGAANHLDDYEEGTWTPSLSGVSSGVTYNQQIGRYTIIGNTAIVHYYLDITVSAATGSNIRMPVPAALNPEGSVFTLKYGGAPTLLTALTLTDLQKANISLASYISGTDFYFYNRDTGGVFNSISILQTGVISGTLVYEIA